MATVTVVKGGEKMKAETKPKMDQPQMWTIQQMADFLQVHAWTVRQWVANKDCPAVLRVGRVIRIQPAAMLEWLQAQGSSARA